MPKKHTQLALLPTQAVEQYRKQQSYAGGLSIVSEVVDYVPVSEATPSQIIQHQHNHYYGNDPTLLPDSDPKQTTDSQFNEDSVMLTLLISTGVSLFLLGFLLAVAIGK
tara:strand:- start:1427 stop:1753 length:327 start_codon:yes stop_codon:yes gene_type:complete